ncbi:MAG: hypothetical protein HOV80_30580 [Polyangiaceae bacterium]|nr:hypothetical protein [Polyangiaceae bacterium]
MPRSFAWITLALAGCLYPDLSEFERCSDGQCGSGADGQGGDGSGAGPNTTVTSTSTGSSSTTGTATTTSGGGDGGGMTAGPCSLGPGQSGSPGIVNPGAPGRCIDVRETTFDEYEAFRLAMTAELYATLDIDPAKCDFKLTDGESFLPLQYLWNVYNLDKATNGPKPVVGLDWCSAYLYCAAAGKSLCGNPNGTSIDMSSVAWESQTEWAQACIADAGELPSAGCTSTQGCSPNALTCASPADTGCAGSAGLHHMLSNVIEFEDNCTHDGGSYEDDPCRLRGLNYADDGIQDPADLAMRCTWPTPDDGLRGDRQDQGGVRCCWDAQ